MTGQSISAGTVFCPGRVINHGDGTYECTAVDCPGAWASHHWFTSCRCQHHNATGPFDCYPLPTATLIGRRCA